MSDFDDFRFGRERHVDGNRETPTSAPSSGRRRHAGWIVLSIAAALLVVFVVLVANDDGGDPDASAVPLGRLAVAV